jgi:menaquinone-dependent protoporphyrinogen oxidase
MSARNVLVAFASQTGTTAGIAEVMADELRRCGLVVDCRPAGDVADVATYDAVILGSGVFLPRRATDGGGFLTRHAERLPGRDLWLYSAGPIGRRPQDESGRPGECPVMDVARAVGARGAAAFGAVGLPADADPLDRLAPVDRGRVRAWARGIAAELAADGRARPSRMAGVAAVI